MLCEWIVEAWREINDDVVGKTFTTTVINTLDASEDDMLWSSDKEDESALGGDECVLTDSDSDSE